MGLCSPLCRSIIYSLVIQSILTLQLYGCYPYIHLIINTITLACNMWTHLFPWHKDKVSTMRERIATRCCPISVPNSEVLPGDESPIVPLSSNGINFMGRSKHLSCGPRCGQWPSQWFVWGRRLSGTPLLSAARHCCRGLCGGARYGCSHMRGWQYVRMYIQYLWELTTDPTKPVYIHHSYIWEAEENNNNVSWSL